MDFKIDALLPATASQLWAIFFDVKRVATLIPGCEDVVEVEKLEVFSAVMRQKIGPFKLEVPTRITIDSYDLERQVSLRALGSDKATGTTIDVAMAVQLEEQRDGEAVQCKLDVVASMQVAGRLASLGYPIVRKRSEQLFAEFEARLRAELAAMDGTQAPAHESRPAHGPAPLAQAAAKAAPPLPAGGGAAVPSVAPQPREALQAPPPRAAPAGRASGSGAVELVFLWPRLGINVAVAVGVAHGAVAFGQSAWWWLAAPLLGAAASLGRRGS
ncbi:CoxG family protein [Bordetella genomosp. 13]|uniref:CoxG family protein n=1 Tax=Bordetella genomosp. 13 TaxID=463040 RepID=UPI0011A6C03A|nr:SRPBCC domain-containing protein [Bordetella genomosp. 13]